MSRREVRINEVMEILYQWHHGRSIQGIANSLGYDRKTVRRYVMRAQEASLKRGEPFPSTSIASFQVVLSQLIKIDGFPRVAISNNRILHIDKGQVSFTYKDRKDNDSRKIMTLQTDEFIRRFLLHVLPHNFMRIRHLGFLSNRYKKHNLSLCRKFLGLSPELSEAVNKTSRELMVEITGIDPTKCPQCTQGTMLLIWEFPRLPSPSFNRFHDLPNMLDSP